MPRDGDTSSVRWFPIDNRFVMHVMNAYTKDKTVIVDYIHRRAFRPDDPSCSEMTPRLFRTAIDLGRGSVTDEVLDSHVVELPQIDPRRAGLDYRFGYVAAVTHGCSATTSAPRV
jgi:carotenoid cleavage dioxygenase-like enzyme